jgi:hypothetical protein
MRHINVKLDDADWSALEQLHSQLQKRRRRALTLSTVLRLVIRAGIEANESVIRNAAAAPIAPPLAPGKRWDAYLADAVRSAAQEVQVLKDLYVRFERRCDQARLTPHGFAEQILKIDNALRPSDLHKWYFEGAVPGDQTDAARFIAALATWLQGNA